MAEYRGIPITPDVPDVWGEVFLCAECDESDSPYGAAKYAMYDVTDDGWDADYAFELTCGHIFLGYIDDPA